MNGPTLNFRVGKTSFASTATLAERHAAIDAANARQRLDGLPDALNPELTDPAKVDAFIAALSSLPADQIKAFTGKTLYLNSPALPLGVSSPTTPEAIAALKSVEIADTQNDLLLLKAEPKIDCALAAKRAADAREAVSALVAEVKTLEKRVTKVKGKNPDEGEAQQSLSNARFRRSAASGVWRENAQAVHRCAPDDSAAAKDAEAAKAAAHKFNTTPWAGGMGQ